MTREEKRELAKTFVWHGSWTESMANMDADTRDKITVALQNYGCFGIVIPSEIMQLNFPFINEVKSQIDKDKANWISTCKRNDANNKKQNKKSKEGRALLAKIEEMKKNGIPLTHNVVNALLTGTSSESDSSSNGQNAINLNNLNNEYDSDCNNDCASEGSNDFVREPEPERNINHCYNDLLNNNIYSSSSTTFKNTTRRKKVVDGVGGNSSSYNKESIFEICLSKGVDRNWLEKTYSKLEAVNFTMSGAPITDIFAVIESKWARYCKKENEKRLSKDNSGQQDPEREKNMLPIVAPDLSTDSKQLWSQFMDNLKLRVDGKIFSFWNSSLRIWSHTGNALVLVVPTDFYESEFCKRCNSEIMPVLQDIFGMSSSVQLLKGSEYFNAANQRDFFVSD